MNAPLVLGHMQAVKLTVDMYHQLDGPGAFAEYERTELLDGTIYAVSPVHRPHGYARDELAYRLRRALEALGSPFSVAVETSVDMAPVSEPIPDITATSAPRGHGAIPLESVGLLVEVSTNTLTFDLGDKTQMYAGAGAGAGAGVPELWVVDVEGKRVHQMWRPGPDGYADRREVSFGDMLTSKTLAGLGVGTAGLV